MRADELLRQVTIPSPCPADWDSMPGDDRVRSCPTCGKSVTNFEALTQEEAASLLAAGGEDLCGRIVRRKDGTVLTSGGGAARQSTRGRVRFRLRSLMAAIAWIAAALGLMRFIMDHATVTAGRICSPRLAMPPASGSADEPADETEE
jgi:hypothetical protein